MMAQAISSARGHLTPDIGSTQPEVLVHIVDSGGISGMTITHAEFVARRIMASAGVKVRFAVSAPRRRELQTAECETAAATETIDVRFAYSVPDEYKPGVLAEARPFAKCGIRITVFINRVSRLFETRLAPDSSILGHVLAHEIGHVLLKLETHSETGLMKARWTDHELVQMRSKIFAFTPAAIQMIQANLAKEQTVTLASRAF
jgi:hypothetical protein